MAGPLADMFSRKYSISGWVRSCPMLQDVADRPSVSFSCSERRCRLVPHPTLPLFSVRPGALGASDHAG